MWMKEAGEQSRGASPTEGYGGTREHAWPAMWVVRRLWSHRHKRWRNAGWRDLPTAKLYGEMGLVNLISLIPSLAPRRRGALVKAGCGKIARPV